MFEWIRALHIAAVIFWIAGMLYLPRLYVYHHQSIPGGEMEMALIGQERRLLRIIIIPAMIAAFVFGSIMIWMNWVNYSYEPWFWLKILSVFIIFYIHGIYAADRKKFARGERPRSEKFYRMMNEVPAVLTIFIVIMAVVEPF